jgi:hypothetical protein
MSATSCRPTTKTIRPHVVSVHINAVAHVIPLLGAMVREQMHDG